MEYILSKHAQKSTQEREIRPEWISQTMTAPARTEPDADDPELLHALQIIPEFDYRVLRVIYNRTKTPPVIVTVYFDRAMKGKL